MHLLNALPQRLDPGATPTFAGLISSSLTSPAATNLTLASGAGNSSVILTPAGTGNVGIGTTTPNSQLDVYKASTGGKLRLSGNTNATYGELIFSSNDASYLTYGSSIEGTGDSNGLNVGDLIFKTGYGEVRTERMKINRSGVVTLANTTAGSAGAGALVVSGGLSAAGASYFGGQVTGARPFMSTGAIQANMTSAGGFGFAGGGTNFYSFGANSATSGSFAFQSISSDASVNFNALTLAAGTGAATFAGAVTIGGNVGFYNASPVAKPTGVAVTAAAIHAALVTLNLIAA